MPCLCGNAYLPGVGLKGVCVSFGRRINSVTVLPQGDCESVDLIFPGLVDLHVHMRGLEQRHKGDWGSESLAALRGGVTVVADMPNNVPRVDSEEVLRRKLDEADSESYVDFVLHTAFPLLVDDDRVTGLKLYPEDLLNDLSEIFARARELGKEVVVHAEDPHVLQEAGRVSSVADHGIVRPEEAEKAAVARIISLARRHGTRTRIAHVTLPETLLEASQIRECRTEVTFHHLILDSGSHRDIGPLAKVNPPLRSKEVVERLRSLVWAGMGDFLVSDHAPHAPEEKARPYEEMPSGMPWLDLAAPVLLTLIEKGMLPWRAVDMYSSAPASWLGIARGSLTPGGEADIVVLKRERWVAREDDLATKAGSHPFLGRELLWRVERVFIRGQLVLQEGEPLVRPGFGSPLRTAPPRP